MPEFVRWSFLLGRSCCFLCWSYDAGANGLECLCWSSCVGIVVLEFMCWSSCAGFFVLEFLCWSSRVGVIAAGVCVLIRILSYKFV